MVLIIFAMYLDGGREGRIRIHTKWHEKEGRGGKTYDIFTKLTSLKGGGSSESSVSSGSTKFSSESMKVKSERNMPR